MHGLMRSPAPLSPPLTRSSVHSTPAYTRTRTSMPQSPLTDPTLSYSHIQCAKKHLKKKATESHTIHTNISHPHISISQSARSTTVNIRSYSTPNPNRPIKDSIFSNPSPKDNTLHDHHSDKTPAPQYKPRVSISPLDNLEKKKQTPQKSERKSRVSLEHLLTPQQCLIPEIPSIIANIYREQEHDDREMYKLSVPLARQMTQVPERSTYLKDLCARDLLRLLTYGEVKSTSVSQVILPLLQLKDTDVFYDLGCGTGKIVLQVAMETKCLSCKGIELMKNRVTEGERALQRLKTKFPEIIVGKQIEILQGDICAPPSRAPIDDATVVFINNVMFETDFMHRILGKLASLPNLERVITLRRICERHRESKCARRGDFCVDYLHPPIQKQIQVSWTEQSSIFCYQRHNKISE